jgi:hypothetical protein
MTAKQHPTPSEFLTFSLNESLKDDKYVSIRPQIMKLAANEQQSATWVNVENTLRKLVANADQLLAAQTSRTQQVFDEVVDDDDGPLMRSNYGGRKRLLRGRRKGGKWTMKYKRSINCRAPRGFSQRQYCKYGRRNKK